MSAHPLLKKPKIEILVESSSSEEEEEPEEEEPEEENSDANAEEQKKEEELLLLALIEHRKKEVENLRQRITYYQSQLDDAEKKLEDTQNKLANLRGHNIKKDSKNITNGKEEENVKRSASPMKIIEGSSQKKSQSASLLHQCRVTTEPSASQKQTRPRTQLLIPSVSRTFPQLIKPSGDKFSSSVAQSTSSPQLVEVKAEAEAELRCKLFSGQETMDTKPKGTKRKLDEQEHRDLIKLIGKNSSPVTVHCQTGCLLPSQHKRKLRSLVLCPTDDRLFMTSALDGAVNLWQVEGRGCSAKLLSSTDCQSVRRWPEDVAWHPRGNKLFSVYSADEGDSQVSILNLNKGKEKTRVAFLKDKPHSKGIINSIMFMPWDKKSFVTGGSDHAVFLWSEKDGGRDSWKPKLLHKENHSSAVMGVAGLYHKDIVMSAGADKRIVGYDTHTGKPDYKCLLDSKCMSVLPNPLDFNLFMVHTGTHERQLRLFDIRMRQEEVHAFGWKQESSESQSALINQAWSPDGLYITSGSADPIIHIFDIRYNARRPSQSIRAHQRRVFKAVWHHALPLLISISSDLNIALHKVT